MSWHRSSFDPSTSGTCHIVISNCHNEQNKTSKVEIVTNWDDGGVKSAVNGGRVTTRINSEASKFQNGLRRPPNHIVIISPVKRRRIGNRWRKGDKEFEA